MTRHHHDFVLLHPSEPKLLAVALDGGLTLPRASSDGILETPQLLTALRDLVALDAVMLRPVQTWPAEPEKGQDRMRLYVLEAQTDGPLPEGAHWLGIDALVPLIYSEKPTLTTILNEDAHSDLVSALRPDWAVRGWFGEVRDWLGAELTRLGRKPLGNPEQLRIWGLSAVLRQRTDGDDIYFKAAAKHFIAEPRITAAVADLFPDLTPEVLALEPTKGWLLLAPFRGEELDETQLEKKAEVMRRFSILQLKSVAQKDALIAAGCADRGLTNLREAVPWLLRESLELHLLTQAERERLLTLEPRILEQLDDLAACGLPETLLHGDLHFGNVVVEDERITIFDWTDTCWSHPFFDLTLQNKWRESDASVWTALSEAYLEPWLTRYDERSVRRALELAESLSPLFYAQSYEGINRAQEAGSGGDFTGVVAYFLRGLLEPPLTPDREL